MVRVIALDGAWLSRVSQGIYQFTPCRTLVQGLRLRCLYCKRGKILVRQLQGVEEDQKISRWVLRGTK